MRSRHGELEERLGPATFRYRLVADARGIRWNFVGARVMGIPVPSFATARISAEESLLDGRYAFDVQASLPLAGLLVHYRGTLAPAA